MDPNLSDVEFDLVKNWIFKNLLQILNEIDTVHSITTDIPPEFGRSYVRTVSDFNVLNITVVEQLEETQIKLDVLSEAVVSVALTLSSSEIEKSEAIRNWVGEVGTDFVDYSSDFESILRLSLQIIFSKSNSQILACTCKSIEGDNGSLVIS